MGTCERCNKDKNTIELPSPIHTEIDGKFIDLHFICFDCLDYFIDRLNRLNRFVVNGT